MGAGTQADPPAGFAFGIRGGQRPNWGITELGGGGRDQKASVFKNKHHCPQVPDKMIRLWNDPCEQNGFYLPSAGSYSVWKGVRWIVRGALSPLPRLALLEGFAYAGPLVSRHLQSRGSSLAAAPRICGCAGGVSGAS